MKLVDSRHRSQRDADRRRRAILAAQRSRPPAERYGPDDVTTRVVGPVVVVEISLRSR
jgi:hypothetical protein